MASCWVRQYQVGVIVINLNANQCVNMSMGIYYRPFKQRETICRGKRGLEFLSFLERDRERHIQREREREREEQNVIKWVHVRVMILITFSARGKILSCSFEWLRERDTLGERKREKGKSEEGTQDSEKRFNYEGKNRIRKETELREREKMKSWETKRRER